MSKTRIDKLFSDNGICARSDAASFIKKNAVTVNGKAVKSTSEKADPDMDEICIGGEIVQFSKFHYYMLNKPEGYITAMQDKSERCISELFKDIRFKNVTPVGRLDKDTTGIIILTDDGELNHRLLSAKNHVWKTYIVTCEGEVTDSDIKSLEEGVNIGEGELTLPAKAKLINKDSNMSKVELSIREGKFHQVKRMFHAIGHEVTKLHRSSFGGVELDEKLALGKYRELKPEEVALWKKD